MGKNIRVLVIWRPIAQNISLSGRVNIAIIRMHAFNAQQRTIESDSRSNRISPQ